MKKNSLQKDEDRGNKLDAVFITIIIVLFIAAIGLSYFITRIFCNKGAKKIKANLLQDSDVTPITIDKDDVQ